MWGHLLVVEYFSLLTGLIAIADVDSWSAVFWPRGLQARQRLLFTVSFPIYLFAVGWHASAVFLAFLTGMYYIAY